MACNILVRSKVGHTKIARALYVHNVWNTDDIKMVCEIYFAGFI